MRKVFFTGTHRVRLPQDTLAAITPLLPEYGITRLADVTGLDRIGIPVVMSVRPAATTLSVSQGKGATLPLAKISAAMEAIELWYAENAVPPAGLRGVPARELHLPYQVTDLTLPEGSLLTEHTRLDWIEAEDLVDGSVTWVPRGAVAFETGSDRCAGIDPAATSNGLASGNTVAEATTHALYEAIERDALDDAQSPDADRLPVDPSTVDDPHCAALIDRVLASGAWLALDIVPSRTGIACVSAALWHEDAAASVMRGSGAHADAGVALSRAITEAAQARLTFIAGARDDISPDTYRQGPFPAPPPRAALLPWPRALATGVATADATIDATIDAEAATDAEESAWLAHRVAEVTGRHPLRVVIGDRDELAVVKVLCPGLRHDARHGGRRGATASQAPDVRGGAA